MRSKVISRRQFLSTLALGAGASLLAACAPKATPTPMVIEKVITKEVEKQVQVTVAPKARAKLSMWVDFNFYTKGAEGLLKSQALEWAQQNNVDLTYMQEQGDTMTARENTAIEAKQLPDVLYTNDQNGLNITRLGQASDLTALVAELDKNMGGFSKGFLAAITVNGKVMGVPFEMSTEEWYSRKDVLDKAGLAVPQTWDEVFAAARKVNNPPNMYGFGLPVGGTANGDCETAVNCFLWGYGGSILDKDGNIALDSQPTRTVLNMIKSAWDDGVIPKEALTWDPTGNNTIYQAGKVCFIQNTGSVATNLKANNPDLLSKTSLTVVPAGPKGRFVKTVAEYLLIPPYTKSKDLAIDLVRWISEPTRYKTLMTEFAGFRIPAYTGLGDLPMWKDPLMKPLGESVPFTYFAGYPGPETQLAVEVNKQGMMGKMLQKVLANGMAIDQAIAETVKEIKKIQDTLKA